MTTTTAETAHADAGLMSASEYARLPDRGVPTELVQGRVVEMNVPAPRQGQICARIDRIVGIYAEQHDLGHVVVNDSGILTKRDPDTVRGADIAFYSYALVPRGPLPQGYLDVVPELVFEVRSPTDRWAKVHAKVSEYLQAGVRVVCVLDQVSERAFGYRDDEPPQALQPDDELRVPDVLGDFRTPVRRFFD